MEPPRIAAVIACHNEAARIAAVVSGALRHTGVAFVIDDGSTDATGAAALASGARVISLAGNRGKGAALIAGLAAAEDFEFAVLLDGDGQHDPSDIPALLARAANDGADLVIGDRMRNAAAMPALRRWVNRWMSRRISSLAGIAIPDTQCGFRVLRLSAVPALALKSSRFEIESEMVVAAARAGLRIAVEPVRVIYHGRSGSKIRPLHDTLRWWRWWRAARRESGIE